MFLRRKSLLLAVTVAFFTSLLLYQFVNYNDDQILQSFKTAYHQGTDSFSGLLKNRITTNQLIFPNSFPLESKDLRKFVQGSKSFNVKELNNPRVFKHDKLQSLLTSKVSKAKYADHPLDIYTDVDAIDLNLDKCPSIQTSASIGVDQPKSVDVSLTETLKNFIEEIDTNPYYKELSPFFLEELKLQLEYNVVDHYWYRLAGSSVWLEEYQAHFMISRIMYSPSGQRSSPLLSLTYGQLFDRNWKELVNTRLVVPTNNLNKVDKSKSDDENEDESVQGSKKHGDKKKGESKEPEEEKHYKVIKFPYFLPIPFWHDFDDPDGKYYGPEDPRLLLVKNKAGYEEPLIVFNGHHRKLTHFDDDNDEKILLKADFYRSMFMCWPWQFQRGKVKTDGFKDPTYDKNYYNKVVELKMKNLPRRNKQKNWTPFISEVARQKDGYDKYINFVYRWANFEVLKCDLVHGTGICSFEYRLNPNLATKEAVGPFRGGTELINVNGLLGEHAEKLIRNDREIWVGFARAHIDDCGCGKNMYRPNLVVVTKDPVTESHKKKNKHGEIEFTEIETGLYKISHVSSSISFNIPIIGWDLLNPLEVCVGPNILIPNGISSWVVTDFSEDKFEDYMTLSLSVADYTVHTINIKGLLREVLKLSEGHIFSEVIETDNLIGFGNDNLVCALKASTDFCYQYGLEHNNQEEALHDIHKIFASEDFDSDELEDNFNIEQVEEFQHEDKEVAEYERALYLQRMHETYAQKKPSFEPSKPGNDRPQPQRQHRPFPPSPKASVTGGAVEATAEPNASKISNKSSSSKDTKGKENTKPKGKKPETSDDEFELEVDAPPSLKTNPKFKSNPEKPKAKELTKDKNKSKSSKPPTEDANDEEELTWKGAKAADKNVEDSVKDTKGSKKDTDNNSTSAKTKGTNKTDKTQKSDKTNGSSKIKENKTSFQSTPKTSGKAEAKKSKPKEDKSKSDSKKQNKSQKESAKQQIG